jgi:hypothetical protein
MTQRQKLEFAINTPTEITLLFDDPIVGQSQYGAYQLYAVEANGMEYSLFAPDTVHEQIKSLAKGQSAIVTRLAAQRGNKIVSTYDVVMPKRVEAVTANNNIRPYVELDNENQPQVSKGKSADPTYQIMLNSLRDAVAISKELGNLIDANRIGITLFIARSKSNSYGGR